MHLSLKFGTNNTVMKNFAKLLALAMSLLVVLPSYSQPV